ncbi:MAG TPA: hypothetical protein VK507_02200 [Iamia sp.]|nr:hypothetical protein [Iamia sp.]
MTVVQEDLDKPDTSTPWPARVSVRLAGAQGRPVVGKRISNNTTIVGETVLTTGDGINNAGVWSLDLPPSSDILPPGTTWRIERSVPGCGIYPVSFLTVPVTGGPYDAFELEDDPMGSITPTALAAHAADQALHGGGLEIAFASISSTVTITGTGGGLFTAAVPGLLVTVPDLARPVYLFGHIPGIQPPGGPAEASFGIYPQANTGIFAALDGVPVPDMDTTTHRTVDPFARLPAHSAGDYVIAGSGSSGNLTARVAASVLGLASLRAVAA